MPYTVDYYNLNSKHVESFTFEDIGVESRWRFDHVTTGHTHRIANTRENLVRRGMTNATDSPERTRIGTITFTEPFNASSLSQYPGADTHYLIRPQTVELTTNGYYVFAQAQGTIVGRGYYGGPVDVEGTHWFQWYSYQVANWAGIPLPYPTTTPPSKFPYPGHVDLEFTDKRTA